MRDSLDLEQLALELPQFQQQHQQQRRKHQWLQILQACLWLVIAVFSFAFGLSDPFTFQYQLNLLPIGQLLALLIGCLLLVGLMGWLFFYDRISWQKAKTERLSRSNQILRQVISDLPATSQPRYKVTWRLFPISLGIFIGAIFCTALIFILLNLDLAVAVSDFIDFLFVFIPIIFLGSVLIAVFYSTWLHITRRVLVSRLIGRWPSERSEYEERLVRLESWRWLWPSHLYFFYRGVLLELAGRYQEAESVLRESLKAGAKLNELLQAWILKQLGYIMLVQEHYNQALTYFEAAVQIRPIGSDSYARVADAYLYQGIEPVRALELVDRSIAMRHKKDRLRLIWATRAWALALVGRHSDADESLDRALGHPQPIPASAEIYYVAGQVNLLKGD